VGIKGTAADYQGTQAGLVETWNGHTWSITSAPVVNSGSNYLYGVSCVSSTNCKAVGGYGTKATFHLNVLTASWNGTTWSAPTGANPSPVGYSQLYSVSCISTSMCFAVGNYQVGGSNLSLTYRWTGAFWLHVTSPNSSSYQVLGGVSCTAITSCFAVGYSQVNPANSGIVERWNGAAWSLVGSPTGPPQRYLNAVACVKGAGCQAVGSYYANPQFLPLAESST
jgi:hypothetical protein